MVHFPILRWGQPYTSLEVAKVEHFVTGEPVAEVSQANPGLVARDLRKGAARAREVLREIPCADLVAMVKKGAELFASAELPLGDGTQTPDDFVRQQSATTGLPEHMCRMNMEKLRYVLEHLDEILASLTRKLDWDILTRGYGEEDGVMRSYQATTPVLGMVLPSNSPGVGTACGSRSSRCRSGWCSSRAHRSPGHPGGCRRRSSGLGCRARRSRSTPAWVRSGRRC